MAYRNYITDCASCRYKNCRFDCFPCVEGLKYIQKGLRCPLWERRLLVQRLKDKIKGELV